MGTLKVIASSRNWIDTRSVETLQKIADFKSVKSVVGLPDLSVGYVPNGTAIISEDRIFPHLIGGDIGCGMSLFESPIKPKKIKVEKFLKSLESIEHLDEVEIEREPLGYNLGTIGKGNHFAELHLVNEVVDSELFKKYGLNQKSLYTLVHSGSRGFGQLTFDRVAGIYNPEEGIDSSSSEAKEYLENHDRAIDFAKESRRIIAERILKTIGVNEFKPVSDTAHNSIVESENGWIHRKGATPTDRGAVIIAGSRGSLSYLVEPADNTSFSNYSLAHGAGRKWERSTAEAKLRDGYSRSDMHRTAIGSRVVCSDKKLLYEEAPQAYKNIDIVIADLVEVGVAKVIATFKPILTYKES
jgi:release factor H-coupled RctB family protein